MLWLVYIAVVVIMVVLVVVVRFVGQLCDRHLCLHGNHTQYGGLGKIESVLVTT